MRITLINSYIQIYRAEPHGILMIAACLEREGHRVQVIDGLFEEVNYNSIKKFNPDVIGVSVMTSTYNKAKEIIRNIKKILPNKKIILGGIHPSTLPKESLIDLKADFAVISEGEKTIIELCNELRKKVSKRNFVNINGLAFFENKKFIITPPRDFIKDLDSLPFPARHLIDMEKYFVPPGYMRGLFFKRIATVITSRGCPYRCIYCPRKAVFGKKYRQRSVLHVIKELKMLKTKYKIEGFHLMDEDCLINKEWMEKFCKEIEKLKLLWSCETRITSINKRLLQMMKKAGCLQIDFGIESGSDKILKILKKDLTINQIKKGCALMKKSRIRFTFYILIGSPNETTKELNETFNLLKEMKPDFGNASFLTILPGSELSENYVKQGKKPDYSIQKKGLSYNYYPLTNVSEVSKKVLSSYQKKCRNYLFKRNLISLLASTRIKYIIRLMIYILTNPILLINSLFKIVIKQKERKTYKIIYDVFYEMQKGFYQRKMRALLKKRIRKNEL